MKAKVALIKEDGWIGAKDSEETWEGTKEDLFMKMLTTNNRLQKGFDGNRHSYDFVSEKMQDEYDAWWVKLGAPKRAEIFANS